MQRVLSRTSLHRLYPLEVQKHVFDDDFQLNAQRSLGRISPDYFALTREVSEGIVESVSEYECVRN